MKGNNDWVEIPVFIHGIMPDPHPGNHRDNYEKLLKNINDFLDKSGKPKLETDIIPIEWGWRQSAENVPASKDEYLSETENIIYDYVKKASPWYSHFNPFFLWRILSFCIRKLFLLGLADLFYYVGDEGKRAVRNSVFNGIREGIRFFENTCPGKRYSLTFITYSAGTIIAHDFLWHLYGRRFYERANEMEIEYKLGAARLTDAGIDAKEIADLMFDESEKRMHEEIDEIRKLIKGGRLRIKRLYTMGSSVTPLILRYHHFADCVREGRGLDPNSIGLSEEDGLRETRWMNFWDKDDFLSFPVEFLYKNPTGSNTVVDRYINLPGLAYVHNKYWGSERIAKKIAENWAKD
ncbi:MAG: hypothetical protein GY771_06880 [bacterium]|nr:hypothetical protein [bacterium]